MAVPQIVAAGGALLRPGEGALLERYVLDASGAARPRVCFVPTASGEDPAYVANFQTVYGSLGVATEVLRFFRRTPPDLRDYLFGFDVVHVGGGNTRSMLAVWRHWGFDAVLREAWERGIVLCGSSAGSLCWFAEGVTDSVAGDLGVISALGFLSGSHCPHYDGEADRRPFYEGAVASGAIADGLACDDGAAVHFAGTAERAAISARPAANVYRVARDGERAVTTLVEVRRL